MPTAPITAGIHKHHRFRRHSSPSASSMAKAAPQMARTTESTTTAMAPNAAKTGSASRT